MGIEVVDGVLEEIRAGMEVYGQIYTSVLKLCEMKANILKLQTVSSVGSR